MRESLEVLAEWIGGIVVGSFTALFLMVVVPLKSFVSEGYALIIVASGVVTVLIFYVLLIVIKNRLNELPCQNDETTDKKEVQE